MRNFGLMFEKNDTIEYDKLIEKKLRLVNRRLIYKISTDVFGGDHLYEMIVVINYVRRKYKQRVPITFDIGTFEFYDKLVYVFLECFCYYLTNVMKHDVFVLFRANHTIWSEGIIYSPLVNIGNPQKFLKKFQGDLQMYHFRRIIPRQEERAETYLSNLMQEINCFLRNNAIEEEISVQLAETLVELVGNASEHGNAECLLDIDITRSEYIKEETQGGSKYHGMNAVVLNFSPRLFFEPLKNKFNKQQEFSDRYEYVFKARNYHKDMFNNNYGEDDFYTISSFQHRISGNVEKNKIGGTGLTSLLRSLEEKADSHLCYLLSGNRILFFEKEYMQYDSNKLVGFNRTNNYLTDIPSGHLFNTISTFVPGVAYNLNYAIKKEWGNEQD